MSSNKCHPITARNFDSRQMKMNASAAAQLYEIGLYQNKGLLNCFPIKAFFMGPSKSLEIQ